MGQLENRRFGGSLDHGRGSECLCASPGCPATVVMFVSDFRKEFYEVVQNQVIPAPPLSLDPEAFSRGSDEGERPWEDGRGPG